MRILLLTQWFDPEPSFKGLIFARELTRRGHEVEVLTGFPNYPGGSLYDGYKVRPYQRECIDGITIHRVPLYPSHDKNALKRIANYSSFAISAAVLGPFLVKKPDVLYVYHPPGTIGLAAVALKTRFHTPIVYDIQDMWPDTIAATGMLANERALRAVGLAMRGVYRISDRIVVLSPGFKKLLVIRGIPEDKVDVIYNWTFEGDMATPRRDSVLERDLGLAGKFNVVFAGTMGLGQGLNTALDASRLVMKRNTNVQLVFIGGGVDRERLEKRALDERLPNVRFLPRVEPSQMGPILAATGAALVHLVDDPLFRITIPSKIQGYMLAGKPILCGVRGDAAALVERAACGLVFPPEDPQALAIAINQLSKMPMQQRKEMGRRGRAFYEEKLSLAAGCTAFEVLFKTACMSPLDDLERREAW